MRGSTKFVAGVAAAMLFVVAACHSMEGSGEQAQQTATPPGYTAPASPPPLTVTSETPETTPSTPGSSASQPAEQSSAPKTKLEHVPVPTDTSSMSLYIRSSKAGIIPAEPAIAPAPVGVMDAESSKLTEPPEPAGHDWSRTTVRIGESAYPAYPSTGTTYVYGHACRHHICPFTAIQKTNSGYTVNPGDRIVVGTPTGVLTYQVTKVASVPKQQTGPLPKWASDSTVKNRIVLITCEYEKGDVSKDNIVVVATLVSAKAR